MVKEFKDYRKGDKWGLCYRNKNIIIPIKYDDDCILKLMEDKWGVIDRVGKEFLPAKYDGISSFSIGGNLFWIELDGKW